MLNKDTQDVVNNAERILTELQKRIQVSEVLIPEVLSCNKETTSFINNIKATFAHLDQMFPSHSKTDNITYELVVEDKHADVVRRTREPSSVDDELIQLLREEVIEEESLPNMSDTVNKLQDKFHGRHYG